MSIERLKVSFIDKDTMQTVNVNNVDIYTHFVDRNGAITTTLAAYYFDEKGTEKEVEIKIIN